MVERNAAGPLELRRRGAGTPTKASETIETLLELRRNRGETFSAYGGRSRECSGGLDMGSVLIGIALVAILCIGWQELEGIGRSLLVLGITGAAGLLLPSDPEPGDNSSDAWDDGDGDDGGDD